jgi:hypothetical protein
MITAALVVCCVCTFASTSALAKPKKPKVEPIDTQDGCTLFFTSKVEAAFGTPVVLQPDGRVCYALVGADPYTAPGGAVTAVIEYTKGDESAPDAFEAVQRIVDPDVAGGVQVETLKGIGKLAYLYPDDGSILVAPNKRVAFRLMWSTPANQLTALTPESRQALIRMARDTVKRS